MPENKPAQLTRFGRFVGLLVGLWLLGAVLSVVSTFVYVTCVGILALTR